MLHVSVGQSLSRPKKIHDFKTNIYIYIYIYIYIQHEISKRKSNWIGHILRRNYLLQQVIEGKVKGETEVTGRRGRRRRKLLDDLKERREDTLI